MKKTTKCENNIDTVIVSIYYTSKCIKSSIWKPINGIFIICPPMSCRLQNGFCCTSSSVEITMPSLLHSRYLMVFDDEHGSVI